MSARQEALDWADELAAAIIADAFGRRYVDAAGLIAARLRLVKAEGEAMGIDAVAGLIVPLPAVKSFTSRDAATLQHQFQADHDDERAHGWAAE